MSRKEKRMIRVGRVDELDGKNVIVETIASAAFVPGTLVKQDGDTFVVDDTAATVANSRILAANKDELRSRSVDDLWTVNEQMQAVHFRSADVANLLVPVGTVVEFGMPMARDGAGKLIPAAAADFVVGHADEDITTTAGDELVRVRIA